MDTSTPNNQVLNVVDKLPQIPETGDPNRPWMPFPTSLVLTREQEEGLVEHVLQRIDTLEGEMGRNTSSQSPDAEGRDTADEAWMPKRKRLTSRYYNHVKDRAVAGTIYEHSNLTASMSQRTTMQMIARANNFFFGTDPWFSAYPVETSDISLADKIDRHARWKIDQTNLRETLEESNEFAFVRGEAVVKSTYLLRERFFKRRGMVMFSEGQMVLGQDGNPIFERDKWIPAEAQQNPDGTTTLVPMEVKLDEAGNPVPGQQAGELLKRDKITVKPEKWEFVDMLAPIRRKLFEGPDCRVVFYYDFLCPLNAEDIQKADIIAHLYDMPFMAVAEMFQRQAAGGAADTIEDAQQFTQIIRDLAAESDEAKSGDKQPRTGFAETSGTQINQPVANFAECYATYDADGDGLQEEIMIVVDRKSRRPIFYDYLDNVVENSRRPFEVVRARPIDGRWYGMGAMEFFEPEQEFIDLLVNRKNYRMSKSGRITLWNPLLTVEGAGNSSLKLNDGSTYTKKDPTTKAEEIIEYVTLPDETDNLIDWLNFWTQLMQLKSGVINAGDQNFSGLPATKLATGVRNIEKSGQELFALYINSLEGGHEKVVKANIVIIYANLNTVEIATFFNGDAVEILELSPDEVRDVEINIEMLLTRSRSEQVFESNTQGISFIKDYYALHPRLQQITAPAYRDVLKALQFKDADELIQPQAEPLIVPQGLPSSPSGPSEVQPATSEVLI